MATVRRPTRLIAAGGCAAALVAAPMLALLTGSGDAPRVVADCPGEINMNVLSEGVPIQSDCEQPLAPAPPAGAPSQELLTSCSGIPGCLSANLYGPGNVQVPKRSTQVQQSQ